MTVAAPPPEPRPSSVRPPVGLLLSIGDQAPNASGSGTHPVKLDHFRAKPGKLNQYAREMAAFAEHYGAEPKVVEDAYFLSDVVSQVLDVRLLAFSQTGFRGRGMTNLAELDPAAFEARVRDPFAGEEFEFFPKDATEVRPELREAWAGEPVRATLDGPDDPRVKRLGIKLVASLEFMLPEIMGVGRVARITTSGRRSTRNLYSAVWDQWSFFGGRLRGVPFRLEVRPARTQRFDPEKRAYVGVDFFEIVLDTPFTYAEAMRAISSRRAELGEPDRERLLLEGRVLSDRMALPAPPGEEERLREEPLAGADDALLNRLALLEDEVGRAEALTVLRGVFGVDDARALSAEDAERYWQMLERAAGEEEEVEGEVVDEPEDPAAGLTAAVESPEDATTSRSEEPTSPDPRSGSDVGAGGEEPDVSAAAPPPDPFAAEPAEPDALAAALATRVPGGSNRGKTLEEMTADAPWFEWALTNASTFSRFPEFVEALYAVAAERLPEVHAKVVGS